VFYFQQLMNTAMGGIDATSIIPTVTNIAFAILLVGFLIGLYQGGIARRRPAGARGHSDQVSGRCHDHRQLGVGLPGRERVV